VTGQLRIPRSFSIDEPLLRQEAICPLRWLPELFGRLERKHLLLTGGTGFFGKWLLTLLSILREEGADIQVTVVSRDPARFLDANPFYRGADWLHWVMADVRHVSLASQHFDLLLHGATDTSAAAHHDRLNIYDSILRGTRNMLENAVLAGIERVLLIGSGAQYGALDAHVGPVAESYRLACASEQVDSAYGEAKRAAETLAALYADHHGFELVHARCFAFSGPGLPLNEHFAIGNFVRDALYADAIVLNSSGTAVRSYLHGADLAAWLLTLLVRGESGQAYNVGSDHAISIADLALRVIARVAPGKPLHILGKNDDGVRSFYVPDISKARSLGLDAWTDLDASIDSMARWGR
jgi:dTDP-glucose 4,6-dehydratase